MEEWVTGRRRWSELMFVLLGLAGKNKFWCAVTGEPQAGK